MEKETRKKSSKLDVQEVLNLRSQGKTQQQIADIFGCSKGAVNNILKANGKTNSLESIKIDVSKVIQLHSEGLSNPEIANVLGCHRSNVHEIITKNGLVGNINPRSLERVRLYNPTKEELVESLKENTIGKIASTNNVSSVTVWKRMSELNVTSPRNK